MYLETLLEFEVARDMDDIKSVRLPPKCTYALARDHCYCWGSTTTIGILEASNLLNP